jgi:hypothetical protein
VLIELIQTEINRHILNCSNLCGPMYHRHPFEQWQERRSSAEMEGNMGNTRRDWY